MLGANPIRKQEVAPQFDGGELWVQEVFYTLQGEGPFSGHPAVFVRLSGCNLPCYFCDTDFESSTWRPSLNELMSKVQAALGKSCKLVVLTGGEPFRQNIQVLVKALLALDLTVQIETNGTLYVDLPWCENLHVVCSPKTAALNNDLVPHISAYKYVIKAGEVEEEDGLPGGSTRTSGRPDFIARPEGEAPVYVMPLDEQDENRNAANQAACIESALKFGYRLTLQTHKIIGVR